MSAAERPAPVGDGLLVVDKPGAWTSHDVVARARRLARTRKVGHAGTLDPMATGVLLLGVGRATRLLTFLVGCDKSYLATIRLGQDTVSDDAEGEVTAAYDVTHLTDATVTAAVGRLTGDLQQVPSAVSAVKIDGRRAYQRVRDGEDVQLPPRRVHVARFEVLAQRPLLAEGHAVRDVDVAVDVSSGAYVRALARDLGAALGTGGHLTALRRTRVGGFSIEDAHPLEELEADTGRLLLPLADAARDAFETRELTEQEARALGYGQRIPARQPLRTEPVAAFAPDGRLVAMLDESRDQARTHVVFAPAGS